MTIKPNQRVALTKALVHKALIALLKKQEVHKISIRELCGMAGINRTTFYNHYGSQYEVLSEIQDWYLTDIAKALESAELHDEESILSRVTLVFEYMEQNLEISRLLFQANIDETFAQRLFALPKIEDLLTGSMKGSSCHDNDREIVSFAIYGSYKLVQDWIAQDERRSAAETAKLILNLAGAVCNWNRDK